MAYAQDAAFGGYYPDTLETLEALGAELVEFSPLCDEALPQAVDLVIIGCGFPDRYADELAANLSLISALKHHVCRGHRIYSEGGGTAYLGRYLILGDRHVPAAGILPVDAVLRRNPRGPARSAGRSPEIAGWARRARWCAVIVPVAGRYARARPRGLPRTVGNLDEAE